MLNRLRILSDQFKNGKLSKESYICKMHGIHKILWEYQDFIRDKNLTSIKISKDSFTITTRNGIVLACDSEDKRAAPMEILNFGDYEADEMWMMRRFLTRKSIVLDVGANI